MQMVRKQTYLTRDQDRRLKASAHREHTTEAEILRRALENWLKAEEAGSDSDPFERLVGFTSGVTDIDHDDIYE